MEPIFGAENYTFIKKLYASWKMLDITGMATDNYIPVE
jgi:hypothetical protein